MLSDECVININWTIILKFIVRLTSNTKIYYFYYVVFLDPVIVRVFSLQNEIMIPRPHQCPTLEILSTASYDTYSCDPRVVEVFNKILKITGESVLHSWHIWWKSRSVNDLLNNNCYKLLNCFFSSTSARSIQALIEDYTNSASCSTLYCRLWFLCNMFKRKHFNTYPVHTFYNMCCEHLINTLAMNHTYKRSSMWQRRKRTSHMAVEDKPRIYISFGTMSLFKLSITLSIHFLLLFILKYLFFKYNFFSGCYGSQRFNG